MNYVVVDLEWNQAMSSKSSVFNKLPIKLRGEIIEIGAVKLSEDMQPAEEFTIDVKPVYFKRMHYKVKKLTGFDVDFATINPYMGSDSVKPFVDVCKEDNKGLFILTKTSNPSSGEFQDRLIDGKPLYELVGEQVAAWGADCMPDEGDYSYVGAVVGATYPEQGKLLRKVMPKTFILVPGYGAQGGKGADLVHFFNEDGLGAIINSSRGIIAAYQQEQYAAYGETGYADASRAAVIAMREDIAQALNNR